MRTARDRSYKFWCLLKDWSEPTFGSDSERGPKGPLKHLEKEVKEALISAESPDGVALKGEIVDCLFLVFDSARRAGMNYDELLDKAFIKLEINKLREWNRSEGDSEQPIEHTR